MFGIDKNRFKWTPKTWTGVSAGLGLAATGLAATGFGAPAAFVASSLSTGAGLIAKDHQKVENQDIIRNERRITRNNADLAMRSTNQARSLASNTALNAYRAGEYDVGRKTKARSESMAFDRIEAINKGSRTAISKLNQAFSKVKGIETMDVVGAVGTTALSTLSAGMTRAARSKTLLENAYNGKGIVTKTGLSWGDKLKTFGIRKEGVAKLAKEYTKYGEANNLVGLIDKFQKTKEGYRNLLSAGKVGLYGAQSVEQQY